jgi:hypothetical protein
VLLPESEALYDVRERTGDPVHASVDEVIDLEMGWLDRRRQAEIYAALEDE